MNVVLIGKTNVGKSTLFNRLIEEKKSIVSKETNTTRDRIYGECLWRGQTFRLIDVGGIITGKIDKIQTIVNQEINEQIKIALTEADLIVFLIDAQTGITSEDRLISQNLKKILSDKKSKQKNNKKTIILAVNKVDGQKIKNNIIGDNFLKLGFGEPILISAVTGAGLGDLLDEIYKKTFFQKSFLAKRSPVTHSFKEEETKIAIMGRANVGKSTLINALLGEKRVIVTPLPHTTREPVDSSFFYRRKKITLIDTAGVRKKGKIKSEIERTGNLKSLNAIKRADVVLVIFDALDKVAHLDQNLVEIIKEKRKGLVLVVNKVDLIWNKTDDYKKSYKNQFLAFWWAPIVFISAKEKKNLDTLLNVTLSVQRKKKQLFDKIELIDVFRKTIEKYKFSQPYWPKAKIFQEKGSLPIFKIKARRITNKEMMPRVAQINLIEKEIRKKFSLWGVPISITFGN